VVEDMPAILRLSQATLEDAGYHCLTAGDGLAALAWLSRAAEIDLIVTDVVLPHVRGTALADQFRRVRPALPVLFVSGYTAEDVVRRGLLAEGLPFLEKPFSPPELVARVRALLDAAP
jgi:DNA-binding response OmpR family regulator